MLSTSRHAPRNQQHTELFADSFSFEAVSDFVYLCIAITSGSDTSLEIKRRIRFANRCYYELSMQIESRVLSLKTKIQLYKTIIMPVLLYGAEEWVLAQNDEPDLSVFERKFLRKIFGPVRVGEEYPIRLNQYSLSQSALM